MKTRTTLFTMLAAIVLGLGVATPAHANSCTPLTLSVTPSTAQALEPVSITNAVKNCSQSSQVVAVKFTLTQNTVSCGDYVESFTLQVHLKPNASRSLSFILPAPPCAGTYSVTEVSSNGGSVSSTLTVE